MYCTEIQLREEIETLGEKVKDIRDTLDILNRGLRGCVSISILEKEGALSLINDALKTIHEYTDKHTDVVSFNIQER